MGKVRRRTRVRSTTDSIRKPVRAGASSKLLRRFTRLTNGFSNKVENHVHAVALFTTYYDFVGVYKTLRVTPAMAAGVSDRLWEVAGDRCPGGLCGSAREEVGAVQEP